MELFGLPSKASLVFLRIGQYMPDGLLTFLLQHGKSPRLQRARLTNTLSRNVAKDLVQQKSQAILEGESNKDVMSLIVKGNASENPETRLSDDEMLAQMQIMILAGHETTANSLSWTALELCKHPEIQTKLRNEIRAMERKIRERGDSGFTAQDFEAMPYMNAVVKESLRFHPVVPNIHRQATKDDVLPLSKPIISTTGELLHELPIPKGTKIMASIAGYNRNTDIFGEDPHVFNPDRWLNSSEGKKGTSVGVYANLFTFSGGLRACIGWRFAVLELQAFLVEIISNFELSLDVPMEKIRREACTVMVPTIEGQVEKGSQLPVRIKPASREEYY